MAAQLLRTGSLRRVLCRHVGRGGEAGGKMSSQMKAYLNTEQQLFNKVRGQGKREYWEGSFYVYAATLAFAGLAYKYLPDTDITDWARDEAEERAARRAKGLPVEYGVNYAALKFQGAAGWTRDGPHGTPYRSGADDEDDDDDDE